MKIETHSQTHFMSGKEQYYLKITNKVGTFHVMNVGKQTVEKIKAMQAEEEGQQELPLTHDYEPQDTAFMGLPPEFPVINKEEQKNEIPNNSKTRRR